MLSRVVRPCCVLGMRPLGTLSRQSLAGDRCGHRLHRPWAGSGSSESACVIFKAKVGAAAAPCPAPGRTTAPPPSHSLPVLPPTPLTLLLVEPPDEAAVAVRLQQQLLEKLPEVDGLPGAGRVHLAVRPALLAGRGWAVRGWW